MGSKTWNDPVKLSFRRKQIIFELGSKLENINSKVPFNKNLHAKTEKQTQIHKCQALKVDNNRSNVEDRVENEL